MGRVAGEGGAGLSPQFSVLSLGGSTNTGLLPPSRNLGLEKFQLEKLKLGKQLQLWATEGKFESQYLPLSV